MQKKVSLKDIAQKLGVSTALVSYVLNNQKEGRIGKEIAQKIRETAQKLNYRPNQLARSLKTNKTFTIGLVVADIANPFFSALARVIEDEADKNRYTVIFGSSDEKPDRSKKLLEVLLDRQVDGLILAPTEGDEAQISLLQENKVPFVLLDRYFPGLSANSIGINNFKAALEGTTHLVQRNRRRIGFIGFQTTLHNLQERKNGYVAALKQGGLPSSEQWVREVRLDFTGKEVEEAIQSLLRLPEPVDALFFASNKISTDGLKYLNALSLRVPHDLAILSFDESDATELFYAPLTHIRQPLLELGQGAVRLLLDSIKNPQEIRQEVLEAKLIVGKSTGWPGGSSKTV